VEALVDDEVRATHTEQGMLSEDKVSHLSHVILQAVKKSLLVEVKSDDGQMLKDIKRVLASELLLEEEIDRKVRAKLSSYSRGIVEGSPEWDVLYRKTFEEETRKHVKG
jgi:hypothetical protein